VHFLLYTLVLVSSLSFAQAARDDSEVVLVDKTDADMTAAISEALSTLDDFLKIFANPPKGTSGFKLKVMVKEGSHTEHFWVTPFHTVGDEFAGTLANDPKVVKNVKMGEEIRFARADISDWGYTKDGKQLGSYTVCVLFKKMPKDEADYYRINYGFDC